jgi:hypothetical protein
MADTVARLIERTIPELEDLKLLGLFNSDEIRSIVKTRTDFEYRINARAPDKIDYLRYIKYEHTLNALRKKRKARMPSDVTSSVSDFACEKRIHFIFSRALKKFQGDIPLWNEYIDFAMRGTSSSRLSKIFPQALRLHPKAPELWIKAAVWEYRHNQNIATARMHMQRAIRLNGTDEQLWIEYFRLELDYVRKVRARRIVLGLSQGDSSSSISSSSSSSGNKKNNKGAVNKKDSEDDQEDKEYQNSGSERDEEDKSSQTGHETSDFLKGTIPYVVYSNACNKVQTVSVEFNMAFLDACGNDFPWLSNAILTNCLEKLKSFESFWDLYARLPEKKLSENVNGSSTPSYGDGFELPEDKINEENTMSTIEDVRNEVETRYNRAIQNVPTPAMWTKYLEWKMHQTELEDEEIQEEQEKHKKGVKRPRNASLSTPVSTTTTSDVNNTRLKTLELFYEAHQLKCLEPDMYRNWVRYIVLYSNSSFKKVSVLSNKKRKVSSSSSVSSIGRNNNSSSNKPIQITPIVIAQYATQVHPTSSIAWKIYISVTEQQLTQTNPQNGLANLNKLYKTACELIDSSGEGAWEIEALWIELLCQTEKKWFSNLKDALKRMRRKKYNDRSILSLLNRCFRWMEIDQCRSLVLYLIESGQVFTTSIPVEIFRSSVAKEITNVNGNGNKCIHHVRKIYELYVKFHPSNINAWLDYVRFELEFGNVQTVTKINWCAKKALGNSMLDLWECEFTKCKLESN